MLDIEVFRLGNAMERSDRETRFPDALEIGIYIWLPVTHGQHAYRTKVIKSNGNIYLYCFQFPSRATRINEKKISLGQHA